MRRGNKKKEIVFIYRESSSIDFLKGLSSHIKTEDGKIFKISDRKAKYFIDLLKSFFCCIKKSSVMIAVPNLLDITSKRWYIESIWILILKRFKKLNISAFVYDLQYEQTLSIVKSLNSRNMFKLKKRQKNLLNLMDVIIVPTKQMEEYIKREYNNEKPVVRYNVLEFCENFDSKISINPKLCTLEKGKMEIAYYANLSRRRIGDLLSLLPKNNVYYNIYGPNGEWIGKSKYYTYHGDFTKSVLLKKVRRENKFGLVLYSDDKYSDIYYGMVSPYKLSFYIYSGLPIITMDKYKSITEFVKKYEIGIVFNNEKDFSSKIDHLTPEEYKKFCLNTGKLAHKMGNGYFTKRMLRGVTDVIKRYHSNF